MKPSPSLSLTVGIQSFPNNRRIGGGATPTEIKGGYILAHSTDLHQVLCQIEMPQLCGMWETTILGHVGVMVRVERTKQMSYVRRFIWSRDHRKVEKSCEISRKPLQYQKKRGKNGK